MQWREPSSTVLEIWNGDEFRGYRKTLDHGDRSSIDHFCDVTRIRISRIFVAVIQRVES
jgi:hypothetical protein